MNKNKCLYCHQYKDDGYLYADDISAITKNIYGKAQQVKWTGKDLNNYEADYDDGSVCKADCYQDCKIVCTNKGKYFLAVDGEWTTYFPISYCPICGRELDLVTARCSSAAKLMQDFEKNMELDNGYIKDLEGEQDEDQD